MWSAEMESKRMRYRTKMREMVEHRGILGDEPRLRQEDLDDLRDEPELVEEKVPVTNVKATPRRPGRKEVDEHQITHVPFRAWCDTCVSGRGLVAPHKRRNPLDDAEREQCAKVSFDWTFLRDQEGAELVPILVGVDHGSGHYMVIRAENRVSDNVKTISQIIWNLRRLGHHGSLEVQTDGEPALIELIENVAAQRDTPTVLRRSPVGDSQSNGRVERAVRSVEELTRVLKIDVEKRAGGRLSVQDGCFKWLLRHVAMILNWRQMGFDARTPHERRFGRPYAGELMAFGQPVLYRINNKVQGGLMTERWSMGTWIGKAWGNR